MLGEFLRWIDKMDSCSYDGLHRPTIGANKALMIRPAPGASFFKPRYAEMSKGPRRGDGCVVPLGRPHQRAFPTLIEIGVDVINSQVKVVG